jgi:uncharacterized glyoxalase superfamily protein PhnB
MLSNRSIPRATVIPVLAYSDVHRAVAWLCAAFDFNVRIGMGSHRAQLNVGEGAVIVRELRPEEIGVSLGLGCSVMIRVENADAHCAQARAYGARIVTEPYTYPFGERQYTAIDLAGYSWTFTESQADVHPADWGGTAGQL